MCKALVRHGCTPEALMSLMGDSRRVRRLCGCVVGAALTTAIVWLSPRQLVTGAGEPPSCNMKGYKQVPGLTAAADAGGVDLAWNGDRDQEVRLRLGSVDGVPGIRELALRR